VAGMPQTLKMAAIKRHLAKLQVLKVSHLPKKSLKRQLVQLLATPVALVTKIEHHEKILYYGFASVSAAVYHSVGNF
jgi:hypothetical protein